MKQPDPTADIYQMLDEVGLTPGRLLATREPMAKMVVTMRGELARKLKEYIDARENNQPTHIEVITEDDNGER